jgi:hypothetical protein
MPDHTRLRSSTVIAQRAIEDVLLRIHVVESGTEKCLPGGLTTCDARIVMPTLVTMDAPPACYGYLSLGRVEQYLYDALRLPRFTRDRQQLAKTMAHSIKVTWKPSPILSHSMEMPSARSGDLLGNG